MKRNIAFCVVLVFVCSFLSGCGDLHIGRFFGSLSPEDEQTLAALEQAAQEPENNGSAEHASFPAPPAAPEQTTCPAPAPTEESRTDLWVGYWTGQIVVTSIDMPDAYSSDEQAALLGSVYPMAFSIRKDDGGRYSVIFDDSKNGEITLTIEDRSIIINFRGASTDSDVAYQDFYGELSEDNTLIEGSYWTGIESVGSLHSGNWSVVLQSQ